MWPFKKKKKEDWKLVETIDHVINWADEEDKPEGRQDTVYYYLYENALGDRKANYKVSNLHNARRYDNVFEELPFYLQTVFPWTQGIDTIKTPSYWDKMRNSNKKYVKELYRRILEA